jgi:hypothetical protein
MDFESFIKEAINEIQSKEDKIQKKKIVIEFEIDWNKDIGKVKQEITLAMSKDSIGLFKLGKDIEKFSGLTLKDAEKSKETPDDAYVYGLCNVMNGGKDIFFWTNGTRLSGAAKKSGVLEAIIEQISHECVHLTRLILSKHVFEKDEEWYTKDLVISDKKGKNIIDEEAFATAEGIIAEKILPYFLDMAKEYIPQLRKLNLNESKNLTGLRRWFKEKWVDVSRKVDGKHPECGRSDADKGAYPKCRPSKKVNSKTPKIASSFSKKEKQSMVRKKRAAEKKPRQGKTPHYTTYKESEEMNINETELCARGKDAAKEKFDVYPSIYANSFAVKVCKGQVKGLDGKKSVASGYQKKKGKPKRIKESFEDLKLDLINDRVLNESYQWVLQEATYKGKKVTLNRPFRQAAAGKKFAVYVKAPSGNVKRIRFGAQGYRVRNANKGAASNFQKRHKCSEKKDRTKAGYWACRAHLYSSLKLASSRKW